MWHAVFILIMDSSQRKYIAIDLKSFYASVECAERRLNPLTTNLVVADATRTDKTICLAVSPSLKEYGIPGRPRLFEVNERVKQINMARKRMINQPFSGKSVFATDLKKDPYLELDFLIAKPRMAFYLEYSERIKNIYLKYIAPEDLHVYSIDEVFIDATEYLKLYKKTAYELTMMMIQDIQEQTGITATAGIGTNLYLCKIAMDIYAKHQPPNENGVRIAELDERTYREALWNYKPITKFWQIGKGVSEKLNYLGIDTMGKLARFSLQDGKRLFKIFGVNAELLIDHAWGRETCTMKHIKQYKSKNNSLSNGQVLSHPYSFQSARIIVQEMAENISLKLISNNLITNSVTLDIGYDSSDFTETRYQGETSINRYGRKTPKHAHGTLSLDQWTSSQNIITNSFLKIYDKYVNPILHIRRITITVNNVIVKGQESENIPSQPIQLELFETEENHHKEGLTQKEQRIQQAIIAIKNKWGKNAILKGIDFSEDATAIERNNQIGGHKA